MKEVKPPRKPLFYYYGIALVVLLLINFLLVPLVARHAVQEVDYGTFMTMTENKEVGKVLNSTATFQRVYAMLKAASDRGEPIQIEIV